MRFFPRKMFPMPY